MSQHPKSRIGAVILAAGESSRFRQPKQLILFGGKTLIRRMIDAACEAGCSPVVVVVGSQSEKIRRALRSTSAVIVENKDWERGMGGSIRTGVQALIKDGLSPSRPLGTATKADSLLPWRSPVFAAVRRANTGRRSLEAVVLLVCDQPSVDAGAIRSLMALRRKTKKAIIASSYADTLGVPALFDRSCFQELLALDDATGAKPIISRNRERIAEFAFAKGGIDIDTRNDYQQLIRTPR